MKIIKSGRKEESKTYLENELTYRCECGCGCIFEASSSEYFSRERRLNGKTKFICPECNDRVSGHLKPR